MDMVERNKVSPIFVKMAANYSSTWEYSEKKFASSEMSSYGHMILERLIAIG